jgi:hypothetical protein
MGYRDGERFWGDQDPRIAKLMQIVQQLQGAVQGKQMELQSNERIEQMKLVSSNREVAAQLTVDKGRIAGDLQIRQAELVVEQQKLALERLQIEAEMQGRAKEYELKFSELAHAINEGQTRLEAERMKLAGVAVKTKAEVEKAHLGLQAERTRAAHESQASDTVSKVTESMDGISQELADAKASLDSLSGLKDQVTQHGQALSLLLQDASNRKKPSGFSLKKNGGKTSAVVVSYPDGTNEEMPVS